jgi:Tfp pilus assembly protein PilO
MKFKQLSKEKRDNIIAIAIGAMAVIIGLYFGLMRYQLNSYAGYAAKIKEMQDKLAECKNEQAQAAKNKEDCEKTKAQVQNLETSLASGDTYEWIRRSLNLLAPKKEDFEISEINKPVSAEVSMFLDFPYQAQLCGISGTGYFHDIGQFVAEFENRFKYFRLHNIILDLSSDKSEKLTFRMQIELLVANPAL